MIFSRGNNVPYDSDEPQGPLGMTEKQRRSWLLSKRGFEQYYGGVRASEIADREQRERLGIAHPTNREERLREAREKAADFHLARHRAQKELAAREEAQKNQARASSLFKSLTEIELTKETAQQWYSLLADFASCAGVSTGEATRLLRTQEGWDKWYNGRA